MQDQNTPTHQMLIYKEMLHELNFHEAYDKFAKYAETPKHMERATDYSI